MPLRADRLQTIHADDMPNKKFMLWFGAGGRRAAEATGGITNFRKPLVTSR
jgi:hypothetical protein